MPAKGERATHAVGRPGGRTVTIGKKQIELRDETPSPGDIILGGADPHARKRKLTITDKR